MPTVDHPSSARPKIKERHKAVAENFRRWKKTHPQASHEEQVKRLDFLADTAFMNEEIS